MVHAKKTSTGGREKGKAKKFFSKNVRCYNIDEEMKKKKKRNKKRRIVSQQSRERK